MLISLTDGIDWDSSGGCRSHTLGGRGLAGTLRLAAARGEHHGGSCADLARGCRTQDEKPEQRVREIRFGAPVYPNVVLFQNILLSNFSSTPIPPHLSRCQSIAVLALPPQLLCHYSFKRLVCVNIVCTTTLTYLL